MFTYTLIQVYLLEIHFKDICLIWQNTDDDIKYLILTLYVVSRTNLYWATSVQKLFIYFAKGTQHWLPIHERTCHWRNLRGAIRVIALSHKPNICLRNRGQIIQVVNWCDENRLISWNVSRNMSKMHNYY